MDWRGFDIKKKLLSATLSLFVGLLLFGTAYGLTKIPILYTAAIAVGTTFYHFAMRLAVGYVINKRFHNRMDYTRGWFQQRRFEPRLYQLLAVKKWKRRLPSFDPDGFLLERRCVADVIQATCQAEIVHEAIMALSFVPVAFSAFFGAAEVFIVTSFASFLFDGIFVIAQRYNRPRLMRLLRR